MLRYRNSLRNLLLIALLTTLSVATVKAKGQAATNAQQGAEQTADGSESTTPHNANAQPEHDGVSHEASPEEARQAEIAAEARKLYDSAAELRAEVAKTYKDSLSITVIKKAQEVEKLARDLKTLMREDAAANKH